MSKLVQSISCSEELLYAYIALKKLRCIQTRRAIDDAPSTTLIDSSTFSRRFILKQLNERLQRLDELSEDICNDLFRQVSGQPSQAVGRPGAHHHPPINLDSNIIKYPEFDEYFHFCLHQLHDFMMGLRWHEADIDKLTKSDSEYVSKHLVFVCYLLSFQRALLEIAKEEQLSTSAKSINEAQAGSAKSPGQLFARKSSLKDHQAAGASSPQVRRRVRFKDLPTSIRSNSLIQRQRQPSKVEKTDLADNHSVFALDLLIYGINLYIQKLSDTLIVWSNAVQNEIRQLINTIFDSRIRVRSSQMQLIAKKIKIYNDVHLTVLDHLSEIKNTYLIRHIRGTLLSKDSAKLLHNYKNPRLMVYIRRIGLDVEVKILARLIRECLQILFNLIICEINYDSIKEESPKRRTTNNRNGKDKSLENVINFMSSWLKVEDVLYGHNILRGPPDAGQKTLDSSQFDAMLDQIQRPNLVAQSSTLAQGNGKYASSSRILNQMDNLSEFMREFLHMIVERLRYAQQVRYFLESVSSGLVQFYDIVAPQLERQLIDIKNKTQQNPTPGGGGGGGGTRKMVATQQSSVDLLLIKIRCLKFIHVIGSADRIISSEALRLRVDLRLDKALDLKLARLTQICMTAPVSASV